jgi:hypothetical protein
MAVARARLLAMADDETMGPPDSPRDDSASALRTADVRLDKDIVAIVNRDNDSTNDNYDCLNLLRSVPTPRLQALEHRAHLSENKSKPQSMYLLRDIHWEKERRKRWHHRETLKERTEQSERSGLYAMAVVPVIHVEPTRALVHLSGRHVVGKRPRPLLEELQEWKQGEIAASRARQAAADAAEVARQVEFEEAKRELDAEIEEMKRHAALVQAGKLDPEAAVVKKRRKRRQKPVLLPVEKQPEIEEKEADKVHVDVHHKAKTAAKERLRSNAITIPRTPDDTKLRPWFHYVKGLKTETLRQSSLLRPTEEQLQETLAMSHKLEENNVALRTRVKHLTKDLQVQTAENKRVMQQATVVREKSGVRIREMDSTIVRLTNKLQLSVVKHEQDVAVLNTEIESIKTKSKQKVLELTGELVGIKRAAKSSGNENVTLQNDLKKQQERTDASNKKVDHLERLLKESKTLCSAQEKDIGLKKAVIQQGTTVQEEQRTEIEQLKELLSNKTKLLKTTIKKNNAQVKGLNKKIIDLKTDSALKLTQQNNKFEKESHSMRVKCNHVELVLDDADKRFQASDKAVRKQLNTERKERGDREKNHDNQLNIAQERILGLKQLTEIAEEERRAVVERSAVLEQELREQIVINEQEANKKVLLAAAHLEQVRREKDEIINSKERQLRTVRGKLTVLKARIADVNSMQIDQKQADDKELLRLQTWVKTLEQRLSDAEQSREQESQTLRKLAEDREILAQEAQNSANIQVAALARETTKVREQLDVVETRLVERNLQMVTAAEESEVEKLKLVEANDQASERTSELVTSFKEQELAWQRNDRALRRKIVQLENEKSDALKLKDMSEVDTELMQAKTLISDLRGEMTQLDLNAAKDRNERKSCMNELILMQDKYKADMAEKNNAISLVQRGQEQLEMDAFAAKNSSNVHQVERKKLQETLDNVHFELRQFKKQSAQEEKALKGELELANASIRALQMQLENFYKDTGSKKLDKRTEYELMKELQRQDEE